MTVSKLGMQLLFFSDLDVSACIFHENVPIVTNGDIQHIIESTQNKQQYGTRTPCTEIRKKIKVPFCRYSSDLITRTQIRLYYTIDHFSQIHIYNRLLFNKTDFSLPSPSPSPGCAHKKRREEARQNIIPSIYIKSTNLVK